VFNESVPITGTRVRILGRPIAVTLSTNTGTIEKPAPEYEGHYMVRLDSPATDRHVDGSTEPITELVEYWDNLETVELGSQH
jgi:hypothetical protein